MGEFRQTAVWAMLTLLTASLSAVAQTHQHQHPDLGEWQPRPVPPVRYSFKGEVKPESTLVRGLLEIRYENRTGDSLGEIRFYSATPMIAPHDSVANLQPPYLKIDSVLSYGVPLDGSELIIDGHHMSIVMTPPLPPKGRAFFITTFETRFGPTVSSGVTFTDWYPRVSAFRDGQWLDRYDSVANRAEPALADFEMALRVDSSFGLAYPGELVNEKEHYGLLPPADNDSLYVDIVNQHQQEFAGIKYRPEFEGGVKRFYIRSKNDIDFSFVAAHNLLRDRAYVDSLTIEVCYPLELAESWARFVAAESRTVVRSLSEEFGPFPYNDLRIAADGDTPTGVLSRQLIVLPADVGDSLLLADMLGVRIAECWQPELREAPLDSAAAPSPPAPGEKLE